MNTNHNSTAISDDIDEYTSQALRVLEVVKAGRLEMQRNEVELKRQQEVAEAAWQAHVNDLWAPKAEAAKSMLPTWMHAYVRWDKTQGPAANGNWVILDLPECLPIEMWPDTNPGRTQDSMLFVVPDVGAWLDDDNEWQVYTTTDHGTSERYPTLEIAVATAHDRYGQYLEACDRAAQRNAEAHAAAEAKKAATLPPAPKPVQIEIPMDPAAKVLAAIAELDLDLDTVFERGLLYGLITIAAELRAIRAGIDDIAAVVVANDPKSQENQQ